MDFTIHTNVGVLSSRPASAACSKACCLSAGYRKWRPHLHHPLEQSAGPAAAQCRATRRGSLAESRRSGHQGRQDDVCWCDPLATPMPWCRTAAPFVTSACMHACAVAVMLHSGQERTAQTGSQMPRAVGRVSTSSPFEQQPHQNNQRRDPHHRQSTRQSPAVAAGPTLFVFGSIIRL